MSQAPYETEKIRLGKIKEIRGTDDYNFLKEKRDIQEW